MPTKKIISTQGDVLLVSVEDYEYFTGKTKKGIRKWSISEVSVGHRYAHSYFGTEKYMHRLVVERSLGKIPKGFLVDHKNGNTLDNRRENLRIVTQGQNSSNSKSKVGLKCTTHKLPCGKYRAKLTYEKQSIHIGCYETPEEAHKAFINKSIELRGKEFVRGR